MRRLTRSFWILSLLFLLSGCSSYRYAVLPGSGGSTGSESQNVIVTKNVQAKVTLVTGEKVTGEVVEVSENELVLGWPGNFGLRTEEYKASDIEAIEVEFNSGGDKATMYSVVGLVALGTLLAVVLSNGLEDGLGGSN